MTTNQRLQAARWYHSQWCKNWLCPDLDIEDFRAADALLGVDISTTWEIAV